MPGQARSANALFPCLPVLLALFPIGQALGGSTPTTTTLASSANPSIFGATVTLTATVTANPQATGKVTFFDAANILGIGTLNGSGVATLNTIMIQAGNRNLRATYSGDGSYASSTSAALPQVVHTVGGNSFTFKGVFPVHAASTVVNMATGDFNRDGTPDIVYPSYYTNDISVLIGDGTGGFAPAVNYPVGGRPTLVAAADFNGDGKLDLFCILTNTTAPFAQMLFGNGDGTFQPAVDVTNVPFGIFFQIAVGDFDGNGTADIALQQGGSVLILLGNGNGTFTNGTTVTTGDVASISVGDFRGIGRADLASGGTIGEMFLNDGGGTATFTSVLAPSLPNPANNPVVFAYIADLHGTGHEDLITGSAEYDLHVVQSNGDGTFQTPRVYGPAPYARTLAAGDFDGDGSLDIITYGTGGWDPNGYSAASVLYNNGDGTFKSSVQVFGSGSCISTESIIVADFNHDGIADFATADGFNGVCVWLGSANPALAATTTTSMDVTVPYQATGEPFQMTATVTSPSGTVNGGSVNFIVPYFLSQRSNSATVSNGTATAQVGSGGLPFDVGVYNGYVTYYGASGFAASGAQPVRIIVTGTPTTTTASAASASFSGSAQNVTLSATVTSAATVNTGNVTFFVTGLGSVSSGVTNGVASAVLGIPGGQAAGTYAINAVYVGATPLGDSSDNSKSLTITGAGTTTTASAASANFSLLPQNVTLNATVTSPNGVVNGGTVSFTVPGVGSATSGIVTNGAASATLTIPAGQAAASYTIQATYSGTSNLSPSSDSTKSLVISPPASTTTTAFAASATFNPAAQTVTLNVLVTSAAGSVNGGTVAFTVTGIGTATSGTVANGAASATLSIPAGQAPGSYAINAVYSGNGTFNGSSDNSKSLTISKAGTTTTASAATANYSTSAQTVTLSATVTSPSGAVNSGTVSFTVPGVGAATSGTVTSGAASATLTIPAGQAAGSYTIQAIYSGTTNLNTSSDSSHSLVISAPASTTTTASAATATFNPSAQTVTLNASVTSTAGAVNGGTVAFTVTGVGTATSGAVANGAASATLSIPAGQAPGSYAINAVYSGTGTVTGSSDGTKSLVISKATTTTMASAASANFSPSAQTVTLNATVTGPVGAVNVGTVSFTVTGVGSATSGTVTSGAASATLTVPAGQAGGSYTILAVYSGTSNLNTSSDSSKSLVISAPLTTTTTASAATATFNASAQTVTLNASVTSTAGTVNGGTVAFTVAGVGKATLGTVANGAAAATLAISAGQAPGSFAINAVYSGNGTLSGSSDGSKSLVISKASTTTTASAASANFSPSAQTVTLNGAVTSPSGAVNSGTVSFTVTGVGTATSGTVTNGAASATLTIPAAQAAGTYAIQAVYSGTSGLNTSSDNNKSLIIQGTTVPPMTFTSSSAATFPVGTSANFAVTVNSSAPATLTETGALPPGVTFDAATGVLSGTPAIGTEGTYPITFTAINGVAPNATQSFTLTVGPAIAITIIHAPATVVCGGSYFSLPVVPYYGIPINIISTEEIPRSFNLTTTLGGVPVLNILQGYESHYGLPTRFTQFALVLVPVSAYPASGSKSVLQVTFQFSGGFYDHTALAATSASSTSRIALPAVPAGTYCTI